MNSPKQSKYSIAYKWLSYCLVAGFAYYWLLTLGLIFFNKSITNTTPRQTALYYAFWKQKWQLFANTKVYNRKLNFIIRDKQYPSKTDTIDIVQYSIAEKRSHAPFNDYYDGLDQLLYWVMNDLKVQLIEKEKILKQQFPGRQDSFYARQSAVLLLADSLHQIPLQNLTNFGKHALIQLHKDTAGKEFQLILVHKFIPPQKPPAGLLSTGDEQTLFISTIKSF